MKKIIINEQVIKTFKSAIKKLTGYKKRIFVAELARDYFDSKPRRVEQHLGVKRTMVELGLKELETGFICLENFHHRGKKKVEEKFENLEKDIKEIADKEGQADPKFQTEIIYLNITAKATKELLKQRGYSTGDFTERTINNVLNRQGYTLKKVLKSRPLKKNTRDRCNI